MRGQWKPPRGYITIGDVARILDWTWDKTWRWGTREKVLVKIDGHWVTTKQRIVMAFPDVLHEHLGEE